MRRCWAMSTANAKRGLVLIRRRRSLNGSSQPNTATATDAAGNTALASGALSVTVDTAAPAAPIIAGDTIVNGNKVMLIGTARSQ